MLNECIQHEVPRGKKEARQVRRAKTTAKTQEHNKQQAAPVLKPLKAEPHTCLLKA